MCVLFGVGNNVSFFEMARRMQVFSMFLLYATSMMYTSVYGLWALFNAWTDKTRTRPIKDVMLDFSNHGIVSRAFVFLFYSAYSALQYFKLGICIFINGMFSQMSDTHVNGNVQSVLYQV